ncbi:MAG: transcription antitermination factor NusB [Clostridia bacterium]|nr:transcription antitermination factor NusB [Clostridia bacterium]MBR5428825.1 transcription antitermination factor NusB [Clostridia bacterium]
MTRSEGREQAFVLVFENIFNPDAGVEEIVDAASDSDDVIHPDEFAIGLAQTVFDHRDEADEVIEKFARGWKVSRLAKVSLAILRLAFCEIMYCDDVPAGVSVNEAVELAKKYATEKEASYINGILGAYLRSTDEK